MGRLIYVADSGNDLHGDGTWRKPFQSEERAEIEGEVGDMILIYDDGIVIPVGRDLPAASPAPRWTRWAARATLVAVLVGAAGGFGFIYSRNPSVALLIVGVGAVLVVSLVDKD